MIYVEYVNIYSIEMPPYTTATATVHCQNGVYYHTQNPKHPKQPFSRYLCDSGTKKVVAMVPSPDDFTIVCPLIMCHPENVDDYINNELPFLEKSCTDIYSQEEFLQCNVFVCHSNLLKDPIYVGLFAQKGIGEVLWKDRL